MANINMFGLLTLILGILVLIFPVAGVFSVSILIGFGILFLGVILLFQGAGIWGDNKIISAVLLLLGIIAIVLGLDIFGNIWALSFIIGISYYIGGFFLIVMGILGFFTRDAKAHRGSSVLLVLMGILNLILGMFAMDPYYLAIIIGITLIIDGITLMTVNPVELVIIDKGT
jgi:membrane protein HdeD